MKTNITFTIKGGTELFRFHPFLHLVDKSESWVSQLPQESKCNLLHFPYPASKISKIATLLILVAERDIFVFS